MYVHEVLVNRLRGLSLPRKSVVRLTDRSDMTLDVYCGRKTTMQQQQQSYTGIIKIVHAKDNDFLTDFFRLYLDGDWNWLDVLRDRP